MLEISPGSQPRVALSSSLAWPRGGPPSSRRTAALIAAMTLAVAALALCLDRTRNGDLYLQLLSGRFLTDHGLVSHDPFATIEHGRPWLNQQWLSELVFYRASGLVGLTGLTVLYAMLVAAPLALLLWSVRRRGAAMVATLCVLYVPGLGNVIHPRAAGFTLLCFSTLAVLILAGWQRPRVSRAGMLGTLAAILALFAIWANLHGGFVAGLLLIALVATGLAIDRWRGAGGGMPTHRLALLGLGGVAAAAVVTVATPLGSAIWSYVASFRNPALYLATKEWEPAWHSVPATIYLALAAVVAALVWRRAADRRPLMPLLAAGGFLAFAALSVRNLLFVGPAMAIPIACCPPAAPLRPRPAWIAAAGLAAGLMALAWGVFLGPARDEPQLRSPVIDYALRHPPRTGRIATYAGAGSYLLWRSPRTEVVINGWIEHFRPGVLRRNYGLLRGWYPNPLKPARRLHVTAVITHLPRAIQILEAHGFSPKLSAPEGTYLVRGATASGGAGPR